MSRLCCIKNLKLPLRQKPLQRESVTQVHVSTFKITDIGLGDAFKSSFETNASQMADNSVFFNHPTITHKNCYFRCKCHLEQIFGSNM